MPEAIYSKVTQIELGADWFQQTSNSQAIQVDEEAVLNRSKKGPTLANGKTEGCCRGKGDNTFIMLEQRHQKEDRTQVRQGASNFGLHL